MAISRSYRQFCDLADQFDALVMVDDSHAVGFMGPRGRGTHEFCGVMGRVDILTGTLGKALGGASGGYTSGRREIIELLRQRSRPYLFSNTLAPSIVGATLKVLEMLSESTALAINWKLTRDSSATKSPAAVSIFCPARTRSAPSCSATRPSPADSPTPRWNEACT